MTAVRLLRTSSGSATVSSKFLKDRGANVWADLGLCAFLEASKRFSSRDVTILFEDMADPSASMPIFEP